MLFYVKQTALHNALNIKINCFGQHNVGYKMLPRNYLTIQILYNATRQRQEPFPQLEQYFD